MHSRMYRVAHGSWQVVADFAGLPPSMPFAYRRDVAIGCLSLQVRRSMARIKHVLNERAIAEPDAYKSAELKRFIDAI